MQPALAVTNDWTLWAYWDDATNPSITINSVELAGFNLGEFNVINMQDIPATGAPHMGDFNSLPHGCMVLAAASRCTAALTRWRR